MMAGGYDHSRDGLAEGCCSARAPCSHQKKDPTSICANCAEAMTPTTPPAVSEAPESDPSAEGAAARRAGETESANPYIINLEYPQWAQWNDGWQREARR